MQYSGEHSAMTPSAILRDNGRRNGRTLCPCCQHNKAWIRKAFRKPDNAKPKSKDYHSDHKERFLCYA